MVKKVGLLLLFLNSDSTTDANAVVFDAVNSWVVDDADDAVVAAFVGLCR